MLPRRQIREEFYRLFGDMSIPKTVSKGRLYRYHDVDLPAINVTTFSDSVINEDRVHGGCKHIEYSQSIVIELHVPTSENYEDDLDDMEEEFWESCSDFNIEGMNVTYQGGEVTPVNDSENPQAVKLLNFTARYSVDSRTPNTIIT